MPAKKILHNRWLWRLRHLEGLPAQWFQNTDFPSSTVLTIFDFQTASINLLNAKTKIKQADHGSCQEPKP